MKKQIISLALALSIVLALVPAVTAAGSDTPTVDDYSGFGFYGGGYDAEMRMFAALHGLSPSFNGEFTDVNFRHFTDLSVKKNGASVTVSFDYDKAYTRVNDGRTSVFLPFTAALSEAGDYIITFKHLGVERSMGVPAVPETQIISIKGSANTSLPSPPPSPAQPSAPSGYGYNEVIAPTYEDASSFSDGLAAVKQNGKWGFVDKAGKVVIPFKYDDVKFISDGDQYRRCAFSEGLAAVCIGDSSGKDMDRPPQWGFIDKTGKEVVPLQYFNALPFSDGLAAVFGVVENDVPLPFWGYIDKTGKIVLAPLLYVTNFSDGVALVAPLYPDTFDMGAYLSGKIDGFDIMNKKGEFLTPLPMPLDGISDFSEGMAAVMMTTNGKRLFGYFDAQNPYMIIYGYEEARNFSDGLAAVKPIDKGGKWGFIDKERKEVIEATFDWAWSFSEGLAMCEPNGKRCYIDKTGKIVIETDYGYAGSFLGGHAPVGSGGKPDSFIDKTGAVVASFNYDEVSHYGDDLWGVKRNGKWGFIAITGEPPATPSKPPTPQEKPSSWAESNVNSAIERGIVPESLQSKYTAEITRAEFAALAVALYENQTGKTIAERKTFTDTKDPNVEKAAALGIVSGSNAEGTLFSPDLTFNREMAAALLVNLLKVLDIELDKAPATFSDSASISGWAAEHVGRVQAAGLMSGSDGKFDPQGKFTRESGIALMWNLWFYSGVALGNIGN
jgi:hypothetical protein